MTSGYEPRRILRAFGFKLHHRPPENNKGTLPGPLTRPSADAPVRSVRRGRIDRHLLPLLVLVLELHHAVDHREERVVGGALDVLAGVELGAALADQDRARGDRLAAEGLHAQVLRIGIAAVAAGADALFMSHGIPLSRASAK